MAEWKRKKPRRTKPHKKVAFFAFPDKHASAHIIDCPRCGREVEDTPLGRRAHGTSCVKIPENRPNKWGVKNR